PIESVQGLLDTLTWRTLPTSFVSFRFLSGDSAAMWFKPLAPCSLKAIRIHFTNFAGDILIDVFRARYGGHITATDSTDALGWVGTHEHGQWMPGWVLGHSPLGEHLWGPFPLTVTNDNDYSWIEVSASLIGEVDLGGDPFCVGLNVYQLSGRGLSAENERVVPYHFFKYYYNCCGPDGMHNGWFLRKYSLWVEVVVSYYGNTPPEITNMDVLNDTYRPGPYTVTTHIVDSDISNPEQAGVAEAFLHWDIFGLCDSTVMYGTLEDNLFIAQIPSLAVGDKVEYYVSAVDRAGARSANTPRTFSRISPEHPEADILLIDYGYGFGPSFQFWMAVMESLGFVYEYWDAQNHQGIDASVVGYGWSTLIPWGVYRMNVPIIPTREYEGHFWADFLQSGTVDKPVNLLHVDKYYFGWNHESQNPGFEPGDFACDFFGLDSANNEQMAGSEKTLYGVVGDPVTEDFSEEPFRHTWPLDWFHQYWINYTMSNERGADLFFTIDGRGTGVRCDGGTFKTVFLPWDIEYLLEESDGDTVPSQDFRKLVGNILRWFGTEKETGIDDHPDELVPKGLALSQNYPNPFNTSTIIHYAIPSREQRARSLELRAESAECALRTRLKIYNILGQEVRTLVDETTEAGYYKVIWDGRDGFGNGVASGVYFYRLTAGEFSQTRKMVLLR
ncbi:MAG: FlgD immunoglobulin-like domain containing protein, partial [bacterium]